MLTFSERKKYPVREGMTAKHALSDCSVLISWRKSAVERQVRERPFTTRGAHVVAAAGAGSSTAKAAATRTRRDMSRHRILAHTGLARRTRGGE